MGCEFFVCNNCNECCCDFAQCSICNENDEMICYCCVENNSDIIDNIIYCKEQTDKYGNLDYCYICDNCLKIFHNEKTIFGFTIEEHFKKHFDINFLDIAKERINNYKNIISSKILLEINITELKLKQLYNNIKDYDKDYKCYYTHPEDDDYTGPF